MLSHHQDAASCVVGGAAPCTFVFLFGRFPLCTNNARARAAVNFGWCCERLSHLKDKSIAWKSKQLQDWELSPGVFMNGCLLDTSDKSSKTKENLPSGVGRLMRFFTKRADASELVGDSNNLTGEQLHDMFATEAKLHANKIVGKTGVKKLMEPAANSRYGCNWISGPMVAAGKHACMFQGETDAFDALETAFAAGPGNSNPDDPDDNEPAVDYGGLDGEEPVVYDKPAKVRKTRSKKNETDQDGDEYQEFHGRFLTCVMKLRSQTQSLLTSLLDENGFKTAGFTVLRKTVKELTKRLTDQCLRKSPSLPEDTTLSETDMNPIKSGSKYTIAKDLSFLVSALRDIDPLIAGVSVKATPYTLRKAMSAAFYLDLPMVYLNNVLVTKYLNLIVEEENWPALMVMLRRAACSFDPDETALFDVGVFSDEEAFLQQRTWVSRVLQGLLPEPSALELKNVDEEKVYAVSLIAARSFINTVVNDCVFFHDEHQSTLTALSLTLCAHNVTEEHVEQLADAIKHLKTKVAQHFVDCIATSKGDRLLAHASKASISHATDAVADAEIVSTLAELERAAETVGNTVDEMLKPWVALLSKLRVTLVKASQRRLRSHHDTLLRCDLLRQRASDEVVKLYHVTCWEALLTAYSTQPCVAKDDLEKPMQLSIFCLSAEQNGMNYLLCPIATAPAEDNLTDPKQTLLPTFFGPEDPLTANFNAHARLMDDLCKAVQVYCRTDTFHFRFQRVSLQLIDNSLQPVNNSLRTADNSLQPVDNSLQPVDNSLQPVDSLLQPVDNSLQPLVPSFRSSFVSNLCCLK